MKLVSLALLLGASLAFTACDNPKNGDHKGAEKKAEPVKMEEKKEEVKAPVVQAPKAEEKKAEPAEPAKHEALPASGSHSASSGFSPITTEAQAGTGSESGHPAPSSETPGSQQTTNPTQH